MSQITGRTRRGILRLGLDRSGVGDVRMITEAHRNDNPNRRGWFDRLMEEQISRRSFLAALGISSSLVADAIIDSKFGISLLEIALYGGDAAEYFLTTPEKRQTPLATKETVYDITNGKSQLLHVDGDSLGAGYFEVDPDTPDAIRQLAESRSFATPNLFAAQVEALAPFGEGEGEGYILSMGGRWKSKNDSRIGLTIEETIQSVTERLQAYSQAQKIIDSLREQGIAEESILDATKKAGLLSDWTWDISMGGNNMLNLLAEHIPSVLIARISPSNSIDYRALVGLYKDFTGILLPTFQQSYTDLLIQMLSGAVTQGSPLRNLRRIFVRGLPDVSQISAIDLARLRGDRGKKLEKIGTKVLTDTEKQVIRVLTMHMNNAIITAIEDAITFVSDKYPRMEIPEVLFESLEGIELDGIHPSERGYLQLAKRRLERCVAEFPADWSLKGERVPAGRRSFWEQAQLTGKTISLLREN